MKKTTALTLISALALTLAACSNGEPTRPDETGAEQITIVTPIEEEVIIRDGVDIHRRRWGLSDEDTINQMLGRFNDPERQQVEQQFGTPLSVLSGVAVGLKGGTLEEAQRFHGMIEPGNSFSYIFRVTENLTGGYDVPEELIITSKIGGIFEIGKEYLIAPGRNYSTLFDIHDITNFSQIISRDLVPESDIELFRRAGAERGTVPNTGDSRHGVRQNASLESNFISKIDLVATVKITAKEADTQHDNVYTIGFVLVDIIHGEEHREALASRGYRLRANADVEVGETYLIMYEHFGSSSFLPAARNGAIVNVRSPEFEQYRSVFAELATS